MAAPELLTKSVIREFFSTEHENVEIFREGERKLRQRAGKVRQAIHHSNAIVLTDIPWEGLNSYIKCNKRP